MIWPILDEITLDPNEEEMRTGQIILNHSIKEYSKKHNLKLPPGFIDK